MEEIDGVGFGGDVEFIELAEEFDVAFLDTEAISRRT